MSEEPRPMQASLLTFHRVITRGLEVSIENARTFVQQGVPGDAIRDGYLSYVQALGIIVDGHHLSEDAIVFPYYRDKLPDVPFDMLSSQHRDIEPELEHASAAIARLRDHDDAALADLEAAVVAIKAIWDPHIGVEEQVLIGRLDEILPVEERFRLLGEVSQFGQAHSEPSFLTVPFMLYNLPAANRATLMAAFPAEVTENLLPIVWKEKWAPMMPFFLP